MIIEPKSKVGIECKCDGCRKKIKAEAPRETFSDTLEDGTYFTKTLCEKCVKEIVEKFRAHMIEKEKNAKDPLQV